MAKLSKACSTDTSANKKQLKIKDQKRETEIICSPIFLQEDKVSSVYDKTKNPPDNLRM